MVTQYTGLIEGVKGCDAAHPHFMEHLLHYILKSVTVFHEQQIIYLDITGWVDIER